MFRKKNELYHLFIFVTDLKVIRLCSGTCKRYPDEGHRWMFNIDNLLVKRRNKVIINMNAGVNAQETILEIIAWQRSTNITLTLIVLYIVFNAQSINSNYYQ